MKIAAQRLIFNGHLPQRENFNSTANVELVRSCHAARSFSIGSVQFADKQCPNVWPEIIDSPLKTCNHYSAAAYVLAMIIHKLIAQHLTKGDDESFYAFQAQDALRWIEQSVKPSEGHNKALDLGCGHGVFGGEMLKSGWDVTFSDEIKDILPQFETYPFLVINLDRDDLGKFGTYDLIICSNVLEHLSKPQEFLCNVHKLLTPNGHLYLSWTNWLSPWGGHEFSPFHYLGSHTGHRFYDKISKRKRKHTPYENLFPTYIGDIIRRIRRNQTLKLQRMAPRYYSEFAFITRVPLLREFITWNCAMLLQRNRQGQQSRS